MSDTDHTPLTLEFSVRWGSRGAVQGRAAATALGEFLGARDEWGAIAEAYLELGDVLCARIVNFRARGRAAGEGAPGLGAALQVLEVELVAAHTDHAQAQQRSGPGCRCSRSGDRSRPDPERGAAALRSSVLRPQWQRGSDPTGAFAAHHDRNQALCNARAIE
jgi:hypothetical protein